MNQYLLSQALVLSLRFQEDGDVGIGVFPKCEEILVSLAAAGGVACECRSTRQTKTGERVSDALSVNTSVIENLLELSIARAPSRARK